MRHSLARATTLFLVLAGGACGQGGSPLKTAPEAAPAGMYGDAADAQRAQRWEPCLREQIERLDDSVSDARSVAAAAMQQCGAYFVIQSYDIWGRTDRSERVRALDQATAFVLERRAAAQRGQGPGRSS